MVTRAATATSPIASVAPWMICSRTFTPSRTPTDTLLRISYRASGFQRRRLSRILLPRRSKMPTNSSSFLLRSFMRGMEMGRNRRLEANTAATVSFTRHSTGKCKRRLPARTAQVSQMLCSLSSISVWGSSSSCRNARKRLPAPHLHSRSMTVLMKSTYHRTSVSIVAKTATQRNRRGETRQSSGFPMCCQYNSR